ncbi:GtrA family protein [Citrobacter sp. wls829]|uniref:GtrA family protein n=1 Tax=Citrobacter sp. wls829 TaxID=2576412 RepID=UPI0010C96AA7|nr:GtrA family protein [Citrobacter sp. wls829]TKU10955.1 GtrA family protein [Citrobacter sp. wls829]
MKFGIVGGVGFIVDAAVMYALKTFTGVYVAKIISFFCAVFVTYLLNRIFTFKEKASGLTNREEFSRYLLLMLLGGVINYTAFYLSVTFSSFIYTYPIFGVAIGSLTGMVFNYITSSRLIYKNS